MRGQFVRLGIVAILVFGVSTGGHGQEGKKGGDDKAEEKKVQALMKKKLEHAQKILEALAINDPKMAVEQAEALVLVRREAGFRVLKTPDYELWADDFEQSAQGLIKAAKGKNLEAARLKYLALTTTCFNCHNYVRDQRNVLFERP